MVVFPPAPVKSPADSLEKTPFLSSSVSSSSSPSPQTSSKSPCQLPKYVDFCNVGYACIGREGGKIDVPRTQVKVTFPPSCVQRQCELFACQLTHDSYKPELDGSRTCITPTAVVGPRRTCSARSWSRCRIRATASG